MKKTNFILMLIFFSSFLMQSQAQTDITAGFTDPNFRSEVYKAISKTATDTIYDMDVTGISINKKILSMEVNSTEQLTATVLPENSTNNAYTWRTSNASIVTVSDSGLVSAVAAGSAYVFATVTDSINVFSDSCLVTVTEFQTLP